MSKIKSRDSVLSEAAFLLYRQLPLGCIVTWPVEVEREIKRERGKGVLFLVIKILIPSWGPHPRPN